MLSKVAASLQEFIWLKVRDGKPTVKRDGKPTVKRDGKPTVKRDGKPYPSHHKESVKNSQYISSSGGSKNQAMFESLLSKMLTDDVISKILCKLVADNQTEFSEIEDRK
ncbi:MAG: hypothetical protein IIT39_06590 [Clostridia bacterium]|nr:hypothetical protein [Clostridia bacterium]